MINIFCIAGKMVKISELKETPNGTKHSTILIEVERDFRNSDGIYESDQIAVEVWRGIAETCVKHCKVGDVLGIKGRIQSREYKANDGNVYLNYDIIAEKVSFLKKEED